MHNLLFLLCKKKQKKKQ